MSKMLRLYLLVGLSCVSLLSSVFLAHKIGEVFFFDRLFYRKSAVYGYLHNQEWNALATQAHNPAVINQRIADLIELTQNHTIDFHQVPAHFTSSESATQTLSTQSSQATAAHHIFTIALIGDSYVYGSGVKLSERFGAVLEKQLNTIRPTRVYELGLPGDNIVDHYAKYLLAQQTLHPDISIITLLNNDLYFENVNKYPGETTLYAQLKLGCPQPEAPLQTTNPSISFSEMMTKYYYPSFSPQYSNLCILKEIGQALPSDRIMVDAFYLPDPPDKLPPSTSLEDKEQSEILHTYAGVFEKRGIPVVTLNNLPGLVWKPVSAKEDHPSAATHVFLAQSLFNEITHNPRWQFKP